MLTISHDGYTVTQADNNHVTLSKNGKRFAHAQCTEKHTEESLHQYAGNLLDLLSKLGIDLANEEPTSTVVLPKVVVDPLVVNQIMSQPSAPPASVHAPWPSAKEVEQIKRDYPIGTRIKLEHMNDSMHPVPDGVRGSVRFIDDAGQLHMDWDNGRSLAVIPNVDKFRKLTAGEAQLEEELEIFCVEMMQELTMPGDFQPFHVSDKDEHLTIRLNRTFSGKLNFLVSFTPESGDTANQEKHTEIAERNADHLLKACRKVLSMYNK